MSNVPIERGGFPEMDDYIWTTFNDAKSLFWNPSIFLDSIKECYGNWKQYKKALLVIETYKKKSLLG
jgi:hypothetical protein